MAQALRRLQRDGLIDSEIDVDLAARAYLAMEVGTLLWWLEDSDRATANALTDTLSRLHPARMSLHGESRSREPAGR